MDRINPEAGKHMREVQKLILEDRISEAEEILKYSFCGTPHSMRPYQPLGWFHIDMRTDGVLPSDRFWADTYSKIADFPRKTESAVENYRRSLSLEKALHTVCFTQSGIEYKRESFASYPAQIIAVKLTCSKKGALSFSCLLERGRFLDWAGAVSSDTIMIKGIQGDGGVHYCGAASVEINGGSVRTEGGYILVDHADSATIYLTATTSYYQGDNFAEKALEYSKKCKRKRISVSERGTYKRLSETLQQSLIKIGCKKK